METLLNAFVVLFIVVDPVGIAALFIALTQGASVEYRRAMAFKGATLSTAMLLVFFFIGDQFLQLLGIGMPAFRIAGGILLFLLAIDMVFARQSGLRSTTHREQEEAENKEDISVFPLAFPLIAGPGALTTVLLMASSAQDTVVFSGMVAIILLVLSITFASLLFASAITRIIGVTGANVLSRMFGLILAAMAVQFVLDGIRLSLAVAA